MSTPNLNYAHFDQNGVFLRTFQADPSKLPPSALIETGQYQGNPRTIVIPPQPNHNPHTHNCLLTPTGWTLEENPPRFATPEEIAQYRYEVENKGVLVDLGELGTHSFDTSRENRSMWLAVQLQALSNPEFVQQWKTLGGDFLTLNASQILLVCGKVYGHVAACFAKEAELVGAGDILLHELGGAFNDV